MTVSEKIDYYRVRQTTGHPLRHVNKAWYGRTWQAEWPGATWCPRAYTRRGIERKAARWISKDRPRYVEFRRWWRANVYRRAEYAKKNTDD
jgi:hypothetical protein